MKNKAAKIKNEKEEGSQQRPIDAWHNSLLLKVLKIF